MDGARSIPHLITTVEGSDGVEGTSNVFGRYRFPKPTSNYGMVPS